MDFRTGFEGFANSMENKKFRRRYWVSLRDLGHAAGFNAPLRVPVVLGFLFYLRDVESFIKVFVQVSG